MKLGNKRHRFFHSSRHWLGFMAVLSGAACNVATPPTNAEIGNVVPLNDGWEFQQEGASAWLPAEVPGDAITDLFRNGQIDNPFHGTNEESLQWVANQNWIYRCIFDLKSDRILSHSSELELVFEGIDTYAEIRLNGTLLDKTDNMHRTHVLPVPKEISSPCTLEVSLKSAVSMGLKEMAGLPRLVPTSNENMPLSQRTSSVTRKAKYHYGWDWGPRLVSCGIWRPVSIRTTDRIASEEIQLTLISLDDEVAVYEVAGPHELQHGKLQIAQSETQPVQWEASPWSSGKCQLRIFDPQRWWPRGMGKQPLYSFHWNNEEQEIAFRFGIRNIEWIRSPDEWGTSFACSVNDQMFFAKGANIIPPDFFPTRAQAAEDQLIKAALDANMNMLRVWGGGVYPSDSFLNKCDEAGLLVWQDFMFACGMVRGDAAHQSNVKREAIDQLKRLRNHASMALICGNNESKHAWENWGWPEAFDLHGADSVATEAAYTAIFDSILPNAIDSLSDLPYWPSSPMADPNDKSGALSGDEHAWRVWFDTLDFDYYSDQPGRFVSEYGLQSLPDLKTLLEVGITEWDSKSLQFRQRSRMEWLQPGLDGWGMMRIYARRYTADPMRNTVDENGKALLNRWIYLSQLTQSIGLREGIERHRNSRGRIAGSLYWQLDDVWPTVSWSTMDHAGRWKLAHHAVKHANADRRVIWSRSHSEIGMAQLHNQSPESIVGSKLVAQWQNERGEVLFEATKTANLQPFESIPLLFAGAPEEAALISWTWLDPIGETIDTGHQLQVKPSSIRWPKATVNITQNGNELMVSTDSMAYGIHLRSTTDGTFSHNGFLLLPGVQNAQHLHFTPHSEGQGLTPAFSVQHFAQFQ